MSVVRGEHNYTAAGKQVYFCFLKPTLPSLETALLSRASATGHDSSGVNSAGNMYFS